MKYLYFSAPWCGPCRMLKPVMEKVIAQGIPVDKFEVDDNKELADQYNIRSIPTIILVDESGKEFARTIGVKPLDHFIQQYNDFTNA